MSQLTDLIALLYSYQDDDIDSITRRITERYKATWINTLSDLAEEHGCRKSANTPKGEDAKYLTDKALVDATSITNTYNRELGNFIQRLFDENPRANRNFYYKHIDEWVAKRDQYKTWQIGLNTDSTARQYAQVRFYANNPDIAPKFRYSAIPPVSKECKKRTAKGVVNLAYVMAHLTPAHINCPHTWVEQRPKPVVCENLWVG